MGWFKRLVGTPSEKTDDGNPSPPPVSGGAEAGALSDTKAAEGGSDVAAVITRWDRAIARTQGRFDDVLQEALTASEPLIAATQGDMGPLTRLWSVVEAKKRKHTTKIANRWDSISEEMSELDDLTDDIMDQQGEKRDLSQCEIEVRYYRAYRDVLARAAENVRAWADSSDDPTARSLFAGSGAQHLAQRVAFDAWETMTRTEGKMHQYRDDRDVPMSLLEQYHASATEYWTTLLNIESDYLPELKQHVPTKLGGYVKTINKTLRRYWKWREREQQSSV